MEGNESNRNNSIGGHQGSGGSDTDDVTKTEPKKTKSIDSISSYKGLRCSVPNGEAGTSLNTSNQGMLMIFLHHSLSPENSIRNLKTSFLLSAP